MVCPECQFTYFSFGSCSRCGYKEQISTRLKKEVKNTKQNKSVSDITKKVTKRGNSVTTYNHQFNYHCTYTYAQGLPISDLKDEILHNLTSDSESLFKFVIEMDVHIEDNITFTITGPGLGAYISKDRDLTAFLQYADQLLNDFKIEDGDNVVLTMSITESFTNCPVYVFR